jgi:hypothetical protein
MSSPVDEIVGVLVLDGMSMENVLKERGKKG